MNVLDMYNIAEKEHIDVLNYNWTNTKARIFEIDKNYYIGLDNKQINNSIEEKEILAEELGHYYCNALYYINSSQEMKDKCELRAQKWAYNILIPYHKLKEKLLEGLNIYDLADHFNVDVEYMIKCFNFYTEKYVILV